MAGHLGHERVTTLNVEVAAVDAERGLLMIRGSVPGGEDRLRHGARRASRSRATPTAPYPAAVRGGESAAAPAEA